jgi:hypothetical protein
MFNDGKRMRRTFAFSSPWPALEPHAETDGCQAKYHEHPRTVRRSYHVDSNAVPPGLVLVSIHRVTTMLALSMLVTD